MEERPCHYCGKMTTVGTKYCSGECRIINRRINKRTAYRKAHHNCTICGKHVAIPNKKLCPGQCADIAREQSYQKKRLRKLKPKILIEKKCALCGQVFQSRHVLNIYCSDETCRKKRSNENNRKSREILLANRKSGVAPPKKIKEKPFQKNIFLNFVKIQAQCPRCSIRHDVKVVAGSTRWIYCSNCRNTVFSGNYDNRMDVEGCRQATL